METIVLVAIGSNYAIGKDGVLPWQGKQRGDMKRFIDITMGFPIIVGRKTYEESFPKRPLPGRTNIVVSRQATYFPHDAIPMDSLEGAIAMARYEGKEKAYIIGGAEIYRQALPIADELDITVIHHDFPADTFFPAIDRKIWQETERIDHPADEKNQYRYSFLRFTRIEKR